MSNLRDILPSQPVTYHGTEETKPKMKKQTCTGKLKDSITQKKQKTDIEL